jgi:predicted DNA-binding WGR domain protein
MEIRLEKHDPGKNLARYYRMSVHPNLFGEWTLQREWGRIGQGGRVRLDLFRSLSEAKSALKMLESAKQRRQYEKTLQAQHDHLKPS